MGCPPLTEWQHAGRDRSPRDAPTPERYFSTGYRTARDRSRSVVSRVGGSLTALALTTRGPERDTLTIDANSGFRIWSPTWELRPDSQAFGDQDFWASVCAAIDDERERASIASAACRRYSASYTISMRPPITIHVPGPLRAYCAGAEELSLSAHTVRAALEDLEHSQAALYRNVCDETGALRRHLNVFVNSDNVRDLDGLDTRLKPGDVVTILPAVSGG